MFLRTTFIQVARVPRPLSLPATLQGAFWSGHKKFPSSVTFDPGNALHMDFMIAATNMFASMLSVHPPKHTSELNDPSNRWYVRVMCTNDYSINSTWCQCR